MLNNDEILQLKNLCIDNIANLELKVNKLKRSEIYNENLVKMYLIEIEQLKKIACKLYDMAEYL